MLDTGLIDGHADDANERTIHASACTYQHSMIFMRKSLFWVGGKTYVNMPHTNRHTSTSYYLVCGAGLLKCVTETVISHLTFVSWPPPLATSHCRVHAVRVFGRLDCLLEVKSLTCCEPRCCVMRFPKLILLLCRSISSTMKM